MCHVIKITDFRGGGGVNIVMKKLTFVQSIVLHFILIVFKTEPWNVL